MKLHIKMTVAALALAASGTAGAAFVLLPTPENNSYATYGTYQDALGITRDAILMNGIPIALKYDDYWSYSAVTLNAIQSNTTQTNFLPVATYGTYDFSVGTGGIAVNLNTNAGGATNIDPNGSGVTMQDPIDSGASNTMAGFTGTWGGTTQTYSETPPSASQDYDVLASEVNGTTTVGEMLTYLQTLNPDATIPVVYADYNQTGSFDSLWVSAMFQVWDSTQTTLLAEWDLDTITNTQLDVNAPTFNYGLVNFYGSQSDCDAAGLYDPVSNPDGCAGVTTNGDEYLSLDHNKGSGKPDFLAYSPDMDLSQFLSTDLFVFTVNVGCIPGGAAPLDGETLGCNTNGGEEFGIVGAVAPPPPPNGNPEPGMLALLGIGLAGLGWNRRRKAA